MMKVVRNLDQGIWRQFVEQHQDSNIFHTPEMYQVLASTPNHKPEIWAVVDHNHEMQALLLPVRVTLMNGLLRYLTTRSVAYGSLLCANTPVGQDALALLLYTYIRETDRATLFTELRNLSDLASIQPILRQAGFRYEDHLNYIIDLRRSTEDIWQSLKSNVRTNVRKARKHGVVVKEATNLAEVRAGYGVLEDVYRRIQVPLAPVVLFEAAFEHLYPKNMLRCFLAYIETTCVGAAFRLLHKGAIYAWYAGVRTDYRAYKVQDLLNWHVLEWGAGNGYQSFDFGGAGKPDQEYGPRDYKAKFNGRLVNYGRNIYVHTPAILKVSQVGYEFYRRIKPKIFAETISPES